MSQLDAIALSKAVKQRLVDFALDTHYLQDSTLTEACRTLWSGNPEMGGLLSDLWIEAAFPAKTSDATLDTMVKQNQFHADLCDHLDNSDAIPRHRLLYTHQYEAIRAAQVAYPDNAKPALVVTAGTGAGKTESFLLPILHDLFSQGKSEELGVKCIILYPMNALVNDQVDRLYKWLSDQKQISLFHFTGETPEDKSQADKENVQPWKAGRMLTRQEARGLETHTGQKIDISTSPRGPIPDIIITNYSMLEYMLCRPQDAIFFGKGLRSIVLDEAHLYTGTLAAEITLLLRRLMERCELRPEQVLHIATSATIGSDIPGELEHFAATLFTKNPSLVKVIRGETQRLQLPAAIPPEKPPAVTEIVDHEWLGQPTIELDDSFEPELKKNVDMCRTLAQSLSLLVSPTIIQAAMRNADSKPAVLLHGALRQTPLLHQLESILWERRRLPLHDLALKLWGFADEQAIRATTTLLQLGASARENATDYPLLPNRIHMQARPTDGLVVCLNSNCNGPDNLKLERLGCIAEGQHDHCAYCHSATLSLYRCGICGTWVIASIYHDQQTSLKPVPSLRPPENIEFLTLDPSSKAVQIHVDMSTGRCEKRDNTALPLYTLSACPQCHNEEREEWKAFAQSAQLTLSIVAESVLAELPEYPRAFKRWLPARGRRMLVFSDSRQGAARLGPRLTRQHEIQLVRSAILQCFREQPVTDEAWI